MTINMPHVNNHAVARKLSAGLQGRTGRALTVSPRKRTEGVGGDTRNGCYAK